MPPALILDAFAAVMLAVAAVSAARLAAARPWRRGETVADIDIAHLLMAIAMNGMLTGSLRTIPVVAWESALSVLLAWLVFRAARDVRASGLRTLPAVHLVHGAAMLYMFLAAAQPSRYPALAYAFALILAGYAVWDLDRLSAGRPSAVTAGCRTAMGVTMAFMLIVMA
ncbi:MAG TPA: DUF5134 domain-containing protein [Streptosporangiaceae bacterium]